MQRRRPPLKPAEQAKTVIGKSNNHAVNRRHRKGGPALLDQPGTGKPAPCILSHYWDQESTKPSGLKQKAGAHKNSTSTNWGSEFAYPEQTAVEIKKKRPNYMAKLPQRRHMPGEGAPRTDGQSQNPVFGGITSPPRRGSMSAIVTLNIHNEPHNDPKYQTTIPNRLR